VLGKLRTLGRRATPPAAAHGAPADPIAAFRDAARGPLRRALRTRDEWLRELDAISAELKHRGLRAALGRAAVVGEVFAARFASHRAELWAVRAPRGAQAYHRLWVTWLWKVEEANAILASAASQRDMDMLDQAAAILAEARPLLAALTGDRAALARYLAEHGASPALPA
jgi:hypothetical protein